MELACHKNMDTGRTFFKVGYSTPIRRACSPRETGRVAVDASCLQLPGGPTPAGEF